MREIKKYIIIVSVMIIFLITIIVGIIFLLKNKEIQEEQKMQDEYASHTGDVTEDIISTTETLKDNDTYFSIEKMVKDYYLYMKAENKEAILRKGKKIYHKLVLK